MFFMLCVMILLRGGTPLPLALFLFCIVVTEVAEK